MRVKIITERASSLSYDFANKQNIFLIPIKIIIGDNTLKDDSDEKAQQFLIDLQTMEEIPSTAIPSLGEMTDYLRQATAETDRAIYITITSKLSGIYSQGVKAAEILAKEGKDIRIFDSETVVSMEGLYVYKANELSKQGKSIDEIMAFLENARSERLVDEFVALETLKYLEKNGRIGKAKAMISNLFSFKPVITIKNGVIEPIGKIRTNEQAIDFIIERIREGIIRTGAKKLLVMYDFGLDPRFVKVMVQAQMQREFDIELITYNQLSTAIACHSGPEAWGVGVFYER